MTSPIASFDVFDTLLTRPTGSPETAFLMLGRRLERNSLLPCSSHAFALQRAQAEHRCFSNAGGLDSRVSLADIYAELAMGLPIDATRLIQEELAFETENLTPIPEGVELLRRARRDGKRIAFLSDMYLSQQDLSTLLVKHKLMMSGDCLLVSSDYGYSKRSGLLFRELMRQEHVDPDQITHCGNDATSDQKSAAKLGLQTLPFPQGNTNRFEKMLDQFGTQTEGMSSTMAGASRIARLSESATNLVERQIVDTTAGVAAPLLVGFVLWVLARAQADNIERLYFIARDGQLLHGIASKLVVKLDLSIQLHYVYGSRRSWQAGSLDMKSGACLDAMIPCVDQGTAIEPITTRELLDRFNIEPNEIREQLTAIGLPKNQWDIDLNPGQIRDLRNLLVNDQPIRDQLQARANEADKLLRQYLIDTGLAKPGRCAIVDLGTGGTLYNSLATTLEAMGAAIPEAYYLGQRKLSGRLSQQRRPQVYLYDVPRQLGHYQQSGIVGFLEAVCSADHGTTIGYRRNGETVEPILALASSVERVRDWGHPLVVRTVQSVLDNLNVSGRDSAQWQADCRAATLASFDLLWQSPSPDQARAWGSFPLDDGRSGQPRWISFARPYRALDATRQSFNERHWWHEGALAMSSSVARMAFSARKQLLRIPRKLRAIQSGRELQTGPIPPAPSIPTASPSNPPTVSPVHERGERQHSTIGTLNSAAPETVASPPPASSQASLIQPAKRRATVK